MSRRTPAALPKSPFQVGQRVEFKTRTGTELQGAIGLVGWLPFPGMWSFEIKTDAGETFKAPGSIAEIKAIEETAAPMIEKTAAGDQSIIPGAERRQIPDAKLKPKRPQAESLTRLEGHGADATQGNLY